MNLRKLFVKLKYLAIFCWPSWQSWQCADAKDQKNDYDYDVIIPGNVLM